MQKLIPLEEARARLPADPRTGLPPSRRWLRRLLLEHGCCIIMARQVYLTEALGDNSLRRLAVTAPCPPTVSPIGAPAPAPAFGESAVGSRYAKQTVQSPEQESSEAQRLIASQRLKKRLNGRRLTMKAERSPSASR